MRDLKIIYLFIPVLLLLFSCNSDTKKTSEVIKQHSSEQNIQSSSSENKYEIVENEKVCMVNDRFMGVKQIPIEVQGITYYGCCQNCVKTFGLLVSKKRLYFESFFIKPLDFLVIIKIGHLI